MGRFFFFFFTFLLPLYFRKSLFVFDSNGGPIEVISFKMSNSIFCLLGSTYRLWKLLSCLFNLIFSRGYGRIKNFHLVISVRTISVFVLFLRTIEVMINYNLIFLISYINFFFFVDLHSLNFSFSILIGINIH